MSVARRTDGRVQARKAHSSPYARPQNSGWSLRKLLEPIRRRVFGHVVENEDQGSRGHQLPRSLSPEDVEVGNEGSYMLVSEPADGEGSEPPRTPSTSTSPKRPVPAEGTNPTLTLENVIEFLTDTAGTTLKREEAHWLASLIQKSIAGERVVSQSLVQSIGRPLSTIEVEGMISLLQKSMSYEKVTPFRFQSATPSRGVSSSSPSYSAATPRKTLKRNPNGVYRWEGSGSAKQTPRRNRYSSPAFGMPQLTLTADKHNPEGDNYKKRKKVDDEHATPSSVRPKLPFPITTPKTPRSNGAQKVSIPAPSPSKLRTPGLLKPTTPSQPSPLRQAWSGSPSSSQEDLSHFDHPQSSPATKQSKAANLVSELIKEVTPAKKPDLSNPYQTASPISKVGPPRRSTRRSRATGRPSAPANDQESGEKMDASSEGQVKDIPAQAIIEATLPKGSKRSRPPANVEKSSSPEAPGPFSRAQSQEANQYESGKTNKKLNGVHDPSAPSTSTSIQEKEEKDVQMGSEGPAETSSTSIFGNYFAPSAPSTNGASSFSLVKSTTAPSRPSKLRFSYQPEGSSAPPSPTSGEKIFMDAEYSAPPPPTITSAFSKLPSTTSKPKTPSASPPSNMDTDATPNPKDIDPKTEALNMNSNSIPTFTFTLTLKPETAYSKQREKAKSKPLMSLPVFDFSRSSIAKEKKSTSVPVTDSSSTWTGLDKEAAVKSFDWSAAGMKAPASTGGTWNCSTCMLSNPVSATEKCIVCEAPHPDAKKAAPPVVAFDWSAAGTKPPSSGGSHWTCSTCMLSNPDSAKDKCTVCESARPGASVQPKTFDWSAAGLTPPVASSGASWTCSTCMLTNLPSATTKCAICEAPR